MSAAQRPPTQQASGNRMQPPVAKTGGGDEGKEQDEKITREMDLGDLDGSTLDGAVCGEARFHWMRRTGQLGTFRPYAELIVTVVLHLIAQFFQFVLITYFTLGVVAPVVHPFQPAQLANSTKHLTQAILANNYDIVDPLLRTLCAQNVSYPWTHRMMMFVLLAKLLPELSNGAWRLYRMWYIEANPNHDSEAKKEEIKQAAYTWHDHQNKKHLDELLDEDNKAYTKEKHLRASMAYRLEDDVTKEWKHRTLLLDVWGNTQKVNTVPKLTQADFPIKYIYKEMDEEHCIGTFSIVWKLFTTIFILIPQILMTLYMLKIGSELIASVGTLGKLVKTALKVKFLLGIPEAIFNGYASQDLKDYIDGTVYYAREERPEPEVAKGIFGMKDGTKFNRNTKWPTWLSIVVKLVACWFCSFIMYDLGYREIIAFRHLCGDYFDTFAGSVAGPRNFLTAY